MPTYAYACKDCDHAFDIHQSFSDDSLSVCPECDGSLRKKFNSVGVVFKGSGFYRNDSREAKTTTSAAKKESGSTNGSGSSDSGGSGGNGSKDGSGSGSSGGSESGSGSSSDASGSGSSSNSSAPVGAGASSGKAAS